MLLSIVSKILCSYLMSWWSCHCRLIVSPHPVLKPDWKTTLPTKELSKVLLPDPGLPTKSMCSRDELILLLIFFKL
jgi:hypothetical protein